jgi:DNA-binding response OmpR family regulator
MLMDCQMPVMDGLEATRQLRLDARHKIVAMTANVMEGEEQRCLDAGMDDYIAKPIDIQVFYATLLRHLRPGMPQSLPGKQQLPSSSRSSMSAESQAALLRMGGDTTLYQPLAASLPGT